MFNRWPGRIRFPVTRAEWRTLVGVFTGDSGSGGTTGLVPAPSAGDFAAGKYLNAGGTYTVPPGSAGTPTPPQGRLTLASGVPVMTTTQSAKTTLYYAPYEGRHVPLWDGSSAFAMTDTGGELSQATTDTTKSPAAVTTNSNYDVFVWSDSGTMRATRGPAWSSSSSRGTGAGTTELELLNGIYVNKNAITNGPAARRGTYVGTVRSNGSSQLDWTLGSSASGGGAAVLNVWNMYNRVKVSTYVGETADTWTYASATWRPVNNSANNSISFVYGVQGDGASFWASFGGTGAGSPSAFGGLSLGLDSTSSPSAGATYGYIPNTDFTTSLHAALHTQPAAGSHVVTALEYSASNTINMRGDWGSAYLRSGVFCDLRM